MKKIVCTSIILTLCLAFTVTAQENTIDEPFFEPTTPEVHAQGGSFTAVSHGYNALFTNPAGFSRKKGSFTLASADIKAYLKPDPFEMVGDTMYQQNLVDQAVPHNEYIMKYGLINILSMEYSVDPRDLPSGVAEEDFKMAIMISALNDYATKYMPGGNNGLGVGPSAGFGIAGKGLGIGAAVQTDLFATGKNTLSINANGHATAGLIAGFSFPISLGDTKIYIGGDARPMYRIRPDGQVGFDTVLGLLGPSAGSSDQANPLDNLMVLHGFGLGLDAGTIVESGPITLGFSVRDILGTQFYYQRSVMSDFLRGLEQSIPPQGQELGADEPSFVIPMSMNFGVGFHPDLGFLKYIIDPIVHAEYRHVFYQSKPEPSMWTNIHAGAEVKVLSLVKLRAGINQGYITGGAGIKLLFADVNMSFFTRELGLKAGAKPNSGFSVEAAIRF